MNGDRGHIAELMPRVNNWFEFPAVQRDMIEDDVRISKYESAIAASVRSGDVVLDLGTGTGILAFLALRAGARKVYAIERADIIEVARENAFRNGLADQIEFIKEDSRFVSLRQKVDCVVSEIIGHLALEENMLDALVDARERFLTSTGRMVPLGVDLYFAPTSYDGVYNREIAAWNVPRAGFDMSAGYALATNNVYVQSLPPDSLIASPKRGANIDLERVSRVSVRCCVDFSIAQESRMTGFAGWFKAELAPGIALDTSPNAPSTHWGQCFLPIRQPCMVSPGDLVSLDFSSKSLVDDVVYEWTVSLWRGADAVEPVARFEHSTSCFVNRDSLDRFWQRSRRRGSPRPKQMLAQLALR